MSQISARNTNMRRSSHSVALSIVTAAALAAGSACSGDDHTGTAISGTGTAGEGGGAGGGGTAGGGGGPSVPREIDGQLVINEVMAANALTAKDETGAARSWIEILNPTDVDVPLGG